MGKNHASQYANFGSLRREFFRWVVKGTDYPLCLDCSRLDNSRPLYKKASFQNL